MNTELLFKIIKKYRVELVLLVLTVFVYSLFSWPTGHIYCENIASTNDGVTLSETRALLEGSTFDITNYRICAEGDTATVNGKMYSNKPLGTSVAALPFYKAGMVFEKFKFQTGSKISVSQPYFVENLPFQSISDTGFYYNMQASPFIATSSDVYKIKVRLGRVGEPSTGLIMAIVSDNNGAPTGSVAGEIKLINPKGLDFQSRAVKVRYNAQLIPGQKYWLILGPANSNVSLNGYYFSMGLKDGGKTLNLASADKIWVENSSNPFFILYSKGFATPSELSKLHTLRETPIVFSRAMSIISASFAVVFIYRLFLVLGLSKRTSIYTSLIYAFATLNWRYSSVVFSHALTNFLVIITFYLAILLKLKRCKFKFAKLLFGALVGLTMFVDYRMLWYLIFLVMMVVPIKEIFTKFSKVVRENWQIALGALPFMIFILGFNSVVFGSPFSTAFKHYNDFPVFQEKFFGRAHLENTINIVFGGTVFPDYFKNGLTYFKYEEIYGILYMCPYIIFSVFGFRYLKEKYKHVLYVVTPTFFVSLFFLTFTVCSWGGGTHDYRYILGPMTLLFIPLAFYLDNLLSDNGFGFKKSVMRSVFFSLVVLSLYLHWSLTTTLYASTPILRNFNNFIWPFLFR